jgi:hypothetical protein
MSNREYKHRKMEFSFLFCLALQRPKRANLRGSPKLGSAFSDADNLYHTFYINPLDLARRNQSVHQG